MPRGSTGATKAVEDAHKRLEALDAELEELEREVSRRDHAELEAIRTRSGVDAITAAREAAVSARAQLEHARNEREAVLDSIPELESASDKEQLLHELASAAQSATDAATGTHTIVSELVELLRNPLERLASLNRDLVDAQANYAETGLMIVPGWTQPPDWSPKPSERLWDVNGPERKEVEGSLRRQRGKSLMAVLGGSKPEHPNDPVYMLVWKLVEAVKADQRREDLARAKEQERAAAEERAKAQERRELYSENAILTAPFPFADEIHETLSAAGIEIRGRDVFTEKLPGELKGQELVRLSIPLPETHSARVALWENMGKDRVMENVRFNAASPHFAEHV